MWITVDFDSSEAIYMQLCNQIVEAIAVSKLQEGESLPSVRQMAEYAGIICIQSIRRMHCFVRRAISHWIKGGAQWSILDWIREKQSSP